MKRSATHAAEFVVPLPANGQPAILATGGYKYVFFFFAPVSFKFSLDGTTFLTGYQGLQLGPFDNEPSLTLLCNNQATSVIVFCGNFPFSYFPNQMGIPTYPIGSTIVLNQNVKSAVYTGFNGSPAVNIRKQITVNNTGGQTITILDGLGNAFDTVATQSTKTYVTGGSFQFVGLNGGIAANIGELFYALL